MTSLPMGTVVAWRVDGWVGPFTCRPEPNSVPPLTHPEPHPSPTSAERRRARISAANSGRAMSVSGLSFSPLLSSLAHGYLEVLAGSGNLSSRWCRAASYVSPRWWSGCRRRQRIKGRGVSYLLAFFGLGLGEGRFGEARVSG
jgi:hypothetical protein